MKNIKEIAAYVGLSLPFAILGVYLQHKGIEINFFMGWMAHTIAYSILKSPKQ